MLEILTNAFQVFSEGVNGLPLIWRGWIYLMLLVNGIAPLFFLPRFSSILVLLSSSLGIFIGLVLTHATGYTKLLGLMHFPWVPMVAFQIHYLRSIRFQLTSPHDYWLLTSLLISMISLIIDFKDVIEYTLNH